MKNLILVIAAVLFFSLNISAQSGKNVPVAVKNAFLQKYEKATDVKWSKENKTEWEAEFKLSGKAYTANFDLKGVWVETEYQITEKEIPAAIKTVIQKDYSNSKFKAAEVSETSKGKVVEVAFTKGLKSVEIVFDEKGKVLKE